MAKPNIIKKVMNGGSRVCWQWTLKYRKYTYTGTAPTKWLANKVALEVDNYFQERNTLNRLNTSMEANTQCNGSNLPGSVFNGREWCNECGSLQFVHNGRFSDHFPEEHLLTRNIIRW
tara:strand:+ start:610 stop:963 length:354 start_codon:yes stop_codon:yes gene_type:complete